MKYKRLMLGLIEKMGYIAMPPKKMLKERQGFCE